MGRVLLVSLIVLWAGLVAAVALLLALVVPYGNNITNEITITPANPVQNVVIRFAWTPTNPGPEYVWIVENVKTGTVILRANTPNPVWNVTFEQRYTSLRVKSGTVNEGPLTAITAPFAVV